MAQESPSASLQCLSTKLGCPRGKMSSGCAETTGVWVGGMTLVRQRDLFASCEIPSYAACRLRWKFFHCDVPLTVRCRRQPNFKALAVNLPRALVVRAHLACNSMSREMFRHNGVTTLRRWANNLFVYTSTTRNSCCKERE